MRNVSHKIETKQFTGYTEAASSGKQVKGPVEGPVELTTILKGFMMPCCPLY